MKFVITGGNFNNKGAQAMSFIVCAELRKTFPDCEIVMADTCYNSEEQDSNLRFSRIQDCLSTRMILGGNLLESSIARTIWFLKKIKNHSDLGLHNLRSAFSDCSGILDVSGYAVGSNMSNKINLIYLYLMKIAHKNKIPIYLLPQSFGPLDFNGAIGRYIDAGYRKYLKEAKMIFAREQEGKTMLVSRYGLSNVFLSWDIVLQNKELDYSLVMNNLPIKEEGIVEREYIGIIPSSNNYLYNNNDKIDSYYVEIINHLLNEGEKTIIAYHSGNDRSICRRIKKHFADNHNVVFDDHEYDFYEFENLTRKFKFMISSRYHSIVLAYKECTPCIVFAWAIKYHELTKYFLQDDYILNIKDVTGADTIIEKIRRIQKKYAEESKVIKEKLTELEHNTCFERVFQDMRDEVKS